MKKIISFLLIAAMALTLSACGNEANTENTLDNILDMNGTCSDSMPINTKPLDSEKGTGKEENLTLLTPDSKHNGMRVCCGTDEGYYFLESNRKEKYFHLMYIDYATRQEVFLCSDSSCRHDRESCSSVFLSDEFYGIYSGSQLFTYKDKLFYLSTAADSDQSLSAENYEEDSDDMYESLSSSKKVALYRMNYNGSQREKILELEQGQLVESNVIGDGDSLWFITKTPDVYRDEKTGTYCSYSKSRRLIKFNLEEKKITEIIPLDEHNNIFLNLIGTAEDKLILCGTEYPEGKKRLEWLEALAPYADWEEEKKHISEKAEFYKRCSTVYFTFDKNTREIKELFREKGTSCKFWQKENYLYISGSEKNVAKVNFLTGEAEALNIPDGYFMDGFLGDKIAYRSEDDADLEYYCFADEETGEMKKSKVIDNLIRCIFAETKDKALVLYSFGASQYLSQVMALIDIEDIYNDNADFKPIITAERS